MFYYIKVGCKEVFITRTCFRDDALMDAKMDSLTKRWLKIGLSHEKLCLGFRIKRTSMSYFAVNNACELLKASGILL